MLPKEGVTIQLVIQIGKSVIDVPMRCLIGPDTEDDVLDRCLLREFVVLSSDEGSLLFFPWQEFLIRFNVLQQSRVGLDGFLLQVAHEPMTSPRSKEVRQEKDIEEDALGSDHHEAEEDVGILEQHILCKDSEPSVIMYLPQSLP